MQSNFLSIIHWLINRRGICGVVIQHWIVITASTKRNTLTLEDRVKVVKLSDGGKSARKIADFSLNTMYTVNTL